MVTFGPLFPTPQYMLAVSGTVCAPKAPLTLCQKELMIPACVFFATSLSSLILFFPQSLNHLTLGALVTTQLGPIQALIKMQDNALATDPKDIDGWHKLSVDTHTHRRDFVRANGGIEAQAGTLQLEVTRGRISAGQLAQLIAKTKDLAGAAFGVGSFIVSRLASTPTPLTLADRYRRNAQDAGAPS